jgi:hypothetical protein
VVIGIAASWTPMRRTLIAEPMNVLTLVAAAIGVGSSDYGLVITPSTV